MTPIRSFHDLRAWQEAVTLTREVFHVVDAWPPHYAFLADQMRRAARSVHANIAEGHGRPSRRDYVRYLRTARGSLQEVEADIEAVRGTALLTDEDRESLRAHTRNAGRLLDALIRSLSR